MTLIQFYTIVVVPAAFGLLALSVIWKSRRRSPPDDHV